MNPAQNPVAAAQSRTAAPRKRPAILDLIQEKSVMDKFSEIMGENSKSYVANVLQTIQFTPELMAAEPKSVITAAMIAASLDLPIDKNLGFAAIVPYRDKDRGVIAQFQIMTRGYVQLAQRTRQYENIHVTEIYDDELESFDILTGIPTFKPLADGWRSKAYSDSDKENTEAEKHIVGYAATFVLLSGFRKTEYWPNKKIDAHGRRFSKTFNSAGSPWQTNRPAMRKKTVLKALFKWGPLSVNIQMAMKLDGARGSNMTLIDLEPDDLPAGEGEPADPVPPAGTPGPAMPPPAAETEATALRMGVPENPGAEIVTEATEVPPAAESANETKGAEPVVQPAQPTSPLAESKPAAEGQPGLGIF